MIAPVERPWIVDTVVIRNFLLVGRLDVLLALAGGVVCVPPVILHPDDFRADRPPSPLIGPLSDLGKGFWYYWERFNSPHLGEEEHALTEARLVCFVSLPEFVHRGEILVTELDDDEIQWFARNACGKPPARLDQRDRSRKPLSGSHRPSLSPKTWGIYLTYLRPNATNLYVESCRRQEI